MVKIFTFILNLLPINARQWGGVIFVVFAGITLVSTHVIAYRKGKAEVREQWQADVIEQKIRGEAALFYQREEHAKVLKELTLQLEAAARQKEKVKVVTKEVVKYVSKKSDNSCTIPDGFVWMWNSSLPPSPGVSSRPPRDVDAPTSVKLSDVGIAAALNNAECVERGEVIKAWQKWYEDNQKTHNQAVGIASGRVIKRESLKQDGSPSLFTPPEKLPEVLDFSKGKSPLKTNEKPLFNIDKKFFIDTGE